MNRTLTCRRTFIALVAILCLTCVGLVKGVDVSMAIASTAAALAGANAFEGKRGSDGQAK